MTSRACPGSPPLIVASILSKKLAGGAPAFLFDVKVGNGALMQTEAEGVALAEALVAGATAQGRRAIALLSDMNQPLGSAVGNSLEMIEAIETLRGNAPADYMEHCLHVTAHVLHLGGRVSTLEEGRELAERSIQDGSALEKLRLLVKAQGGDVSYVDDTSKFERAKLIEVVKAPRGGYISQVHARTVGEAAVALGAGRAKKGDPIDHAVGFLVLKKVGDAVQAGEPLCEVHANDAEKLKEAHEAILSSYQFSNEPVPPLPLFYE